MTADRTVRQRWLIALLAVVLLVLSGVLVAVRVSLPADGTATAASTARPDGVVIDVLVADTALRSGDVVVAVDGVPLATRSLPRPDVGEELTYVVRRGNQVVEVDVPVRRYPVRAALGRNWSALPLVGAILLVGAYVFWRRPDDRGAQLLLIVAALLACGATSSVFGLQVLDLGGGPGWWSNLLGGVGWIFVWPVMLHLALVFPTPGPILARWPRIVAAVYLAPVALYAIQLAVDLPRAASPLQRAGAAVPKSAFEELLFLPLILVVLISAYRSSDATMRTRLRWVGGSFLGVAALYLGLWRVPVWAGVEPLVPQRLHLLLLLPCPVAIAVAILRLHLFDIDVAVRRSLVYAGLTAFVVGGYVATVGLFSLLLQGHTEWWVGLIATGLVAVLFSPLHRRLRCIVSRYVYGERDDPYAIVSRLGERLETTPAPDELLPGLVATVAEALRLPYAAIELVRHGEVEEAARYGTPSDSGLSLPLSYQGELVGYLLVGERSPGEGFGRRDRRALAGLAAQLGMAVRAARLSLDLQRSRERLVVAREEERRRIRRDLHDGLGPVLAATALQLQAARRLVRDDPPTAETILGGLSEHVKAVIADIRTLVDDLRPPSLDQLGLVGAIEEQASRFGADHSDGTLDVVVQAEGDLRSLPAAVEVAAFRIVCEAVHNAHRHGHATGCNVRLTRNGSLEVEVTDDGRGFSTGGRNGVGLESMRERVTELGGSFLVEARRAGGTRVWACLPLHPA